MWVSELAHVCVCSHEQFWRPELYRIIIVEPKSLELFVHSSLAPKKVKKMCSRWKEIPISWGWPKRVPSKNASFLSFFPKCLLKEEDGSVLSHDYLFSTLKTQQFSSGRIYILYAERLRKF